MLPQPLDPDYIVFLDAMYKLDELDESIRVQQLSSLEKALKQISQITAKLSVDETATIDELVGFYLTANPNLDREKLRLAMEMAVELHSGQYRDNGEHYVAHPLHVGYIIAAWGLNPSSSYAKNVSIDSVVAAGLLHDVIEEQVKKSDEPSKNVVSNVRRQLHVQLGDRKVVMMVEAMTVLDEEPDDVEDDVSYAFRKVREADNKHGTAASLIKVADTFSNIYTLLGMTDKSDGTPRESRRFKFLHSSGKSASILAAQLDNLGACSNPIFPFISELADKYRRVVTLEARSGYH